MCGQEVDVEGGQHSPQPHSLKCPAPLLALDKEEVLGAWRGLAGPPVRL